MSRPLQVVFVVVLLVAGGAGGWYLVKNFQDRPTPADDRIVSPDSTKPAGKGKLVVLVVFDQFRGDYLDRWATAFGPDGFERIKREGVWYSNCHVPYACTSTGPGHASLATGAPPSKHGIIENDWFDRKSGKKTYCIEPSRPFARVPGTLSGARGQENGVSPEKLLAPTVGDALHSASGGKAKVFSLSIKDRTAVLMGGQKPTGVYSFDNRNGEFYTSAYYHDTLHPWATEFNASRMADKWYGPKWDRLKPNLDYNGLAGLDDAPGEARGFFGQGRIFPHPMEGKEPGRNAQYYTILETSPFGSELLLGLVKKCVEAENLGRGETNDLLCVSFSSNDLVGHQWGPDSWEVLDTTLRSDLVVRELLKLLDAQLGKDRYTLVVTADHGVCPTPESKATTSIYHSAEGRRIVSSEMLAELDLALAETFGNEGRPTQWFEAVEWPWFYLNEKVLKARGLAKDVVADYVSQWLGNRGYMMTAFTRTQIESGLLPPVPPEQQKDLRAVLGKVKLAYQPERCGDVIAIPKPYVLVTPYPAGTSHGSPHAYDSHVPIVVYGRNVPKLGKRDEPVSSLIVAPILAAALGIDPPAMASEKVPEVLKSLPVK